MVSDSGVIGAYNDLQEAKQVLNGINTGNRFIAEVNSDGNLNRDPHFVGGQNQGAGTSAGFNKHWCDWPCINRLMDICEIFMKNGPPKSVNKERPMSAKRQAIEDPYANQKRQKILTPSLLPSKVFKGTKLSIQQF